jgi:L-lysine exporter family protein LysE/ArgO
MELIGAFLQGALFSFSLCFDLGMVNVAIMKTGIERGFKPSFLIGFGSCFGDLFYLSLALFGVSFILDIEMIRWLLWICGTAVLAYLTVKMLRETWISKELNTGNGSSGSKSTVQHFFSGIGLAMASPTSIAWFALVAGPIVAGLHLTQGTVLLAFVVGFFAAGLVWSFAVAVVSSMSGSLFGSSLIRVFSFISALLFLFFAVKVFLQGLNDLF